MKQTQRALTKKKNKLKAAPKGKPRATSKTTPKRPRSGGDWRAETLAAVRRLIREAVPDAVETIKWGDVPVWECAGILCTGETYKETVKLTFAQGASLPDPKGLFNASLAGNARRAIDLRAGDKLNAAALKALFRAAAQFNTQRSRR